jgi:hypothetical protein
MKLTSGGWRFAPLRAFTPEDRVRFIELVRAKARETIRASDDR